MLQEHNRDTRHIKGKDNSIQDALSRAKMLGPGHCIVDVEFCAIALYSSDLI